MSVRRIKKDDVKEVLRDWLKPPSPAVFYVTLPPNNQKIYQISFDDLEEIVKQIEKHEKTIEKMNEKMNEIMDEMGKEYNMLFSRKKKLEEKLKQLMKEKENNGLKVEILTDRFDPAKKIGKVVSPKEYRGIIVFFANQKMVEDYSVGETVTLSQFEVRTTMNNTKYIKAFRIYEEEEKRLRTEIDKITETLQELEKRWWRLKILSIFDKYGIDPDELANAINSMEQAYYKPYSYKSFINFLHMIENMKDEKILDRIREFIRERYDQYLYIEPYGVDIGGYWSYSTKYLIIPLPGGVDTDIFMDAWKDDLRKYLVRNSAYQELIEKIGRIITVEGSCRSMEGCMLTAMIVEPYCQLPPEKVARINMELLRITQEKATIKQLINKIQVCYLQFNCK